MELDVSRAFASLANTPDGPQRYSASQAEWGPRAGPMTWENARADAPAVLTLEGDAIDAARAHFSAYGAWDDEEVNAWPADYLAAMILQEIAAACRECPGFDLGPDSTPEEWAEYERLAGEGAVSSRIFRAEDGRVFFYLGE